MIYFEAIRRFGIFPCSSAVEQSTVNRLAVGSNPTGGAHFQNDYQNTKKRLVK